VPSRVLLATPEVTFGEFDCPPGDPLWGAVNANIDKPHVVIPRTHVVIAQQARRPVLCTPNHVVFYRARQLYRRSLRDRRGDRCIWLEVAPALLDEAGGLPASPAGPGDPGAFLLALALARHLRERSTPEPLFAEDALMRLLDRLLAPARGPRRREAARPRTRAERAELVEAAKELLAARIGAPPSLRELAATLHVSPFHLARLFRDGTGYSPGDYVHGLRMRTAAELLMADRNADLSRLALDLGYCSASHFTDRFRATYGRPPSAVRGAQPRTIVEAQRAAAA